MVCVVVVWMTEERRGGRWVVTVFEVSYLDHYGLSVEFGIRTRLIIHTFP